MKKLIIGAMALMCLAGCKAEEVKATNRIEVVNDTITVEQGAMKSAFKQDVCDSIKVYNAAGEEVACDVIYYTKPVSTQTVGEFEIEVAYKENESVATATLKMVVTGNE